MAKKSNIKGHGLGTTKIHKKGGVAGQPMKGAKMGANSKGC